MILIVGLPFSATLYISTVLQKLGLRTGHEVPGKDALVSWHVAATGPPYGVGQITRDMYPDKTHYDCILHQVRHPVRMITTFQHNIGGPGLWEYICAHCTASETEPRLRATMKFWLDWTALADKCSHGLRYRIEQLPEVFEWFCQHVGVQAKREVLENIPTNMHSHRTMLGVGQRPYLTWSDLYAEDEWLARKIEAKARLYGYED